MSPSSGEVRALLDRFRAEAPEAARSLAWETVKSALEGLSGERSPGDWLASRGGIIAIGSGLGLFAAGFMAGRRLHFDRDALLRTGATLAAGVALGYVAGSCAAARTCSAPTEEHLDASGVLETDGP